MPDYQTLYPYLFNRVTDAVTALQARDYGTAEDILKAPSRIPKRSTPKASKSSALRPSILP